MRQELLTLSPSDDAWPGDSPKRADADATHAAHAARVRTAAEANFEPLWRFMRRLGVAPSDLEDAMQEVVVVAAARLAEVAEGSEKSFLFGTAVRVAARWRRFRGGRREVELEQAEAHADPVPAADALLDQARARTLLDEVLDAMPLDLRAVFTLYEIEELTMAEIASVLGLAPGTVASRLRRAREQFAAEVTRLQARMTREARTRRPTDGGAR